MDLRADPRRRRSPVRGRRRDDPSSSAASSRWSSTPATCRRGGRRAAYTALRHNLGRVLLGLEVLIIADIILTVAIAQTLENAMHARCHRPGPDVPELLARCRDGRRRALAATATTPTGLRAGRAIEEPGPQVRALVTLGPSAPGVAASSRTAGSTSTVAAASFTAPAVSSSTATVLTSWALDTFASTAGASVCGHQGQDARRARRDDTGQLLLDIEPVSQVASLAGAPHRRRRGSPRRPPGSPEGRPQRRRRRRFPT